MEASSIFIACLGNRHHSTRLLSKAGQGRPPHKQDIHDLALLGYHAFFTLASSTNSNQLMD